MSSADEVAILRAEIARQRRWLRLLLVLTLAALTLAALAPGRAMLSRSGAPWPAEDEVRALQFEAHEYRLLDPDGNLRGLWSCPPAGPSLILLDEKGRPFLQLHQLPDGSGLLKFKDGDNGEFQLPRRREQ
jgi:hypothetical protein